MKLLKSNSRLLSSLTLAAIFSFVGVACSDTPTTTSATSANEVSSDTTNLDEIGQPTGVPGVGSDAAGTGSTTDPQLEADLPASDQELEAGAVTNTDEAISSSRGPASDTDITGREMEARRGPSAATGIDTGTYDSPAEDEAAQDTTATTGGDTAATTDTAAAAPETSEPQPEKANREGRKYAPGFITDWSLKE